MICRHLESHRK